MRQGGVLYYIFGDHPSLTCQNRRCRSLRTSLGSTAVVKNTQGGKTELRYTAWGTTRYEYGSTPTDRRYTGQREEASFGLYFYNARWYDPALGRFIQADTIVPGAGNPQAWDRYAYVNNNPLYYTDPSGHWGISISSSFFPNVVNLVGNVLSVSNASERMANLYSATATGLDMAALVIDTAITAADAAAAYIGFSSGAAIAVPGGEAPVIVTGPGGASVGVAMVEIATKPALMLANAFATIAGAMTVEAEILREETRFDFDMYLDANICSMKSNIRLGPGSQMALVTTPLGDAMPTGFMSLPFQAAAVGSDIGLIKPPSLVYRSSGSFSFAEKRLWIRNKIDLEWGEMDWEDDYEY